MESPSFTSSPGQVNSNNRGSHSTSPVTIMPPPPPSHSSSVTSSPSIGRDNREISPQGRYIKLEEKLGSGAYKDVWRAYDTNNGIEVAWNVVKLNRIPPSERKRIKTEVKLLKDIEHKNVIRYYNSWVDREKEQIIFVTELMSAGSLKEYLRKNTMIRWSAVKRWCRQVLTGLEFLHANHIIHRDIKCDNVFINGNTGDLRIGDLGLSTRITEERGALTSNGSVEHRQMTTVTLTCLGTPEFMAPEMYEESYNEKVDIYAFGMCVLEMVTGLTPYHRCTSAAQVYRKVMNGELPSELDIVSSTNNEAFEFIKACLRKHDDRPTATELLQCPFLTQANPQEDAKEVRKLHSKFFTSEMAINEDDEEEEDDEDTAVHSDQYNQEQGKKFNDFHGMRDNLLSVPSTLPSIQSSPSAATESNIHSPSSESIVTDVNNSLRLNNLAIPFSLHDSHQNQSSNSSGNSASRVRTMIMSSELSAQSTVCCEVHNMGDVKRNASDHSLNVVNQLDADPTPRTAEIPLMSPRGSVLFNNDYRPLDEEKSNNDTQTIQNSSRQFDNVANQECHHSILIVDVLDHVDKANTIVLKFKLLNVENTNKGKVKDEDEKVHLAIDFDYNLLNDSSLHDIVEEMCQLDELQHLPMQLTAAEKLQLIEHFEPIVNAAKIALVQTMENIPKYMKTLADQALCRLIFSSSSAAASVIAQDDTKAMMNIIQSFAQNNPQYSCLASKLLTLIQKMHDQEKENDVAKDGGVSVDKEVLNVPMAMIGSTAACTSGETTIATSLSALTMDTANDPATSDAIDSVKNDNLEIESPQSKEDQELEKALKELPEYQELLQAFQAACQRVEKEYSNKLVSINQQRDKVLNSIECQIAVQEQRQVDLEGQMDVMQLKFKERMAQFSARKNQALEERLEKDHVFI